MVESQRLAIWEFTSNIKFGECEIYTPIPLMCPLQVGQSPIYPAWRFYPKPEVGGLMWPSWELEL